MEPHLMYCDLHSHHGFQSPSAVLNPRQTDQPSSSCYQRVSIDHFVKLSPSLTSSATPASSSIRSSANRPSAGVSKMVVGKDKHGDDGNSDRHSTFDVKK